MKTKLILISFVIVGGVFVIAFFLFWLAGFPLLLAFIAAASLAVKAAFCVSHELASSSPA